MSLSLSELETETETNLLERLLKIGHGVWWRVENLQSGRSGDVMGEVSPPFPASQSSQITRVFEFSSLSILTFFFVAT